MKSSEYQKLYDKLRSHGYRANDENDTHLFNSIPWVCKNLEFDNMLDIGASTGATLSLINHLLPDVRTIGIDISLSAAIKARELSRTLLCASALELPFKSDSFDLVTSSDTLEHIEPEDVNKVISEFVRVTKRFIFVQICPVVDIGYWKFIVNKNLHRTIKPIDWWCSKFARAIPLNTRFRMLYETSRTFCLEKL